ncbi:peroxiredoxin-4-like [Microtus oregoni]|uniref:peroxiredoxin-4-like n=1 Tax=Microtus oregoni TaxID=111838 RepID=UPI001BB208C3|nr:peroxiredoxin-4-like [Microtus oregoni]
MDHRSRPRWGISLNRVSGTQIRAPRAPLPFHFEQEAGEGEEWERELPRQRPIIYASQENEELQDNVMAAWRRGTPSLSWGTCFRARSVLEARSKLLDSTTPSRRWIRKVVLILPLLLLFLLRTQGLQGLEAEERFRTRENECHFYSCGQVYPGEVSRVSVADHSLHLSKAKISKPAPYWEGTAVINGEFKELKLTDYRGKYLVFFFYPLDFTFVCPTEIIAFGDRIEEFRSINTEVVACSVDSQFTHLAWINTPRRQGGLGPIRIPLLSDLNHQISKDYGVYLEDSGHTLRGLFIIDDKGVLRQITLNDLPVGRSVDETLRLVQAFQYTDKHGEGSLVILLPAF